MVDARVRTCSWTKPKQLILSWLLTLVVGFTFCPVLVHAQTNLDAAPLLSDLQAAAEKGDAKAQSRLADTYVSLRDSTNAATWYRKAADQGEPHAQWQLARHYDFGLSPLALDRDAARTWYLKAAGQGYPNAQLDLAQIFERGAPGEPDYVEAYKWYTIACTHRSVLAKISRERLILKMTLAQVEEAQKRADEFVANQPLAAGSQPPLRSRPQISSVERPAPPQPEPAPIIAQEPKPAAEVSLAFVPPSPPPEQSQLAAALGPELTLVQQPLPAEELTKCQDPPLRSGGPNFGSACEKDPARPDSEFGAPFTSALATGQSKCTEPPVIAGTPSLPPVLADPKPKESPAATTPPVKSESTQIAPFPPPPRPSPAVAGASEPGQKALDGTRTRSTDPVRLPKPEKSPTKPPADHQPLPTTSVKQALAKLVPEVVCVPASLVSRLTNRSDRTNVAPVQENGHVQHAATLMVKLPPPRQIAQKTVPPLRPLPPPDPALVSKLQLKGIAAFGNRRMVSLNNCNLLQGEEAHLTVDGKVLKLRCTEVKDRSAFVQIEGYAGPVELNLVR